MWNLVTDSKCDVTIMFDSMDGVEYRGDKEFLSINEIEELLKYVPEIRRIFRDDLLEGKAVLLEWSRAVSCDNKKELLDDEYLIFYEVRTVS